MDFAIASLPTPILNTPLFSDVFRYPLPLDSQNLLRAVETVALPGTKFRILGEHSGGIYKVATEEYPGTDLYVDRRFLRAASANHPERKRVLPPLDTILSSMRERLYLPYVWGGNWGQGIDEMLKFYPTDSALDPVSYAMWTLRGLDCSGLLFETTCGATPRNTSQLVRFGQAVPVHGMPLSAIVSSLQPLDLLVWVGHVVIVEDERHVIESRNPVGVVRTSIVARLREILQDKQPVDDWDGTLGPRFVVRRWL